MSNYTFEEVAESSNDRLGLEEAAKLITKATTFVDLLGGASVLFATKPSPVEIYNDRDGRVTNFFRVLREDSEYDSLFALFQTVHNRNAMSEIKLRHFLQTADDPVLRAFCFIYLSRQVLKRYCSEQDKRKLLSLKKHFEVFDRKKQGSIYTALDLIDKFLGEVHGRLYRVQIENNTPEKVIDIYDTSDTVFWIDPESEHEADQFLEILASVKGKAFMYQDTYRAAQSRESETWKAHKIGISGLLEK